MEWNRLYSVKRLGADEIRIPELISARSQFQRDYDRIIFSPAFRRMQSKTQVFPLPGRIFVHNRLTHSLEVASVGRSLGNLLADYLIKKGGEVNAELVSETGAVVSAACLAHDMGNPPFGHSGESAISNFFRNGNGTVYLKRMDEREQSDFLQFDGNANAFRLLTHQFRGKRPGGFALTYTTLASLVKYPYESFSTTDPKFGFFQSEKKTYLKVAAELDIPFSVNNAVKGARHPLVYFTEAADDICYQIMDLEDAFRLGILSYEQVKDLYLGFYDQEKDRQILDNISLTLNLVTDPNEQISYLRAGLIGKLVSQVFSVFIENEREILEGNFRGSLTGNLKGIPHAAMQAVKRISLASVYNHRSVVEIEIAGFKIINTLLEEFAGAVMHPGNPYNKKIISLLPAQYTDECNTDYEKIQSVVDFISGMTDHFALELYRKIKGISLGEMV